MQKNYQWDLTGARLGNETWTEKAWAFVSRPHVAAAGIVTLFAAAAYAVAHYSPESLETARAIVAAPKWFKSVAEPFVHDPAAVKVGAALLTLGSVVGARFARIQARDIIADAAAAAKNVQDPYLDLSKLVLEEKAPTRIMSKPRTAFVADMYKRSRQATKRLWCYSAAALLSVPLCGTTLIGAFALGAVPPMLFQLNGIINRMKRIERNQARLVCRR